MHFIRVHTIERDSHFPEPEIRRDDGRRPGESTPSDFRRIGDGFMQVLIFLAARAADRADHIELFLREIDAARLDDARRRAARAEAEAGVARAEEPAPPWLQ